MDATLQLHSMTEFSWDGRIISDQAFGFAGPIAHIDEGEVIAMQAALNSCRGSDGVLVVGGDNVSASLAMWKGYSTSESMHRHLRPFSGVLIVVDIPTDDNFADISTRPEKSYTSAEVAHRQTSSVARLKAAFVYWRDTWRGSTYFPRTHEVFQSINEGPQDAAAEHALELDMLENTTLLGSPCDLSLTAVSDSAE